MVSKAKWVSLVLFAIFAFISCDENVGFNEYIEISGITPNSVKDGDTLNVLINCAEYNLNITNINQVKLSLIDDNNNRFLFNATGYCEYHSYVLGNFAYSKTVDSLAYNHFIVQCVVDEKFPKNAKVGVFLNNKVLNSNFVLTINDK